MDASAGTGFFVDGANLSLAIASVTDATPEDPATDTRRWLGSLSVPIAWGRKGLPEGFVLQVDNLLVRFNSASGDDGDGRSGLPCRIDWSALYPDSTDALNALSGDLQLSVSGDLWVDLGGFVQVFGGFAFTKSSMDVTLAGET